jgi:8-oxo-dGTP pyrophosphatase MutT (NUDIX family)
MAARDIRYQAAVLTGTRLLLLRCRTRDGSEFWVLPGGGREDRETAVTCVAREVVEEAGVVVAVGTLLYEVPADPPDGTYAWWRTYRCHIVSGEAAPGGGEGSATLTEVRWLELTTPERWDAELQADPFLAPQLHRIRAAVVGDRAPAA